MKNLLILGASGFIGKNLALSFIKTNFNLFGTYNKNFPKELKNKKIKLIKCDLTDKSKVEKLFKNKDIVIQCAATTSGAKDIVEKPYIHVNNNAIMNSVITKAAYNNNVNHVIIFSCTVMYRSSPKALKEKDFDANKEMYPNYFGAGWMKVFVEKMSEFYSRLNRNKYTLIRHSNIYGPYDKFDLEKSHVFGATMTKILKNKDSTLKIWGDGKEKRDLLYIDDLTDFVKKCIKKQKKKYGLYNVGSGKMISINMLADKIMKLSNKNLSIKHDKTKKSLKNNVYLNCDLAKKEIGWSSKISIEQGIKKTLTWYKKNYLNEK